MGSDGAMTTNEILFALLRSEICGYATQDKMEHLSDDVMKKLYQISNVHDLAHIVSNALHKLGILDKDEISQKFVKIQVLSVYRCEQINHTLAEICDVFEKSEIPFMPLKGAVIRKYYPEVWMRTSCDIDILVREEDAEKAAKILIDRCGYVYKYKGGHDISLFSPNKIHLELHYSLLEDGYANNSSEYLKSVWETACVRKGYSYWYEMPDEMFYFYHIAHMAKHFENGGCGIRPFIDLWILDNIDGADVLARDELLERGGLMVFADSVRKLSKIWFENEEYDSVSRQMENYIFSGGVYGSNENRVTVQQQKKGGSLQYALSKIFIPYDIIKFHYPVLQKHRWLTPVMEIRRWFKLVFCGHAKRTVRELKYNQAISADKAEKAKKFLSDIGL